MKEIVLYISIYQKFHICYLVEKDFNYSENYNYLDRYDYQ